MIKIVNNKLVLVIDKTRKSKKKDAGSFYLISHGLLFLLVLNLKYKNEPAFYHGFYDTII